MKLLILGGTLFLGRHVAECALARGHAVTLFTRGRTNPDLLPNAERLVGDRGGDLGALRGRSWDAVIDTSGYVPRIARASAEMLKDAVEHYTFISSISVYAELARAAGRLAACRTSDDDPAPTAMRGSIRRAFAMLGDLLGDPREQEHR